MSYITVNTNQNKVGIDILISDSIDSRIKIISRDNESYFLMTKG